MARPKKEITAADSKTYMQRFASFRAGVCPYCGEPGATLTHRETKKGIALGYSGHCSKCNAENNFTKPECKEQMGN